MVLVLVVVITVLVIVAGAGILWLMKQGSLHPSGAVSIYEDTKEHPGIVLSAPSLHLVGKPDRLLKTQAAMIPIEFKSGVTPHQPHESHILQLIAYCILVEEHYHIRPAYGIIRYPNRQFDIPFTAEYERLVKEMVVEMRAKRASGEEIHRSHDNPRRCNACGVRKYCTERL